MVGGSLWDFPCQEILPRVQVGSVCLPLTSSPVPEQHRRPAEPCRAVLEQPAPPSSLPAVSAAIFMLTVLILAGTGTGDSPGCLPPPLDTALCTDGPFVLWWP